MGFARGTNPEDQGPILSFQMHFRPLALSVGTDCDPTDDTDEGSMNHTAVLWWKSPCFAHAWLHVLRGSSEHHRGAFHTYVVLLRGINWGG